MIENAEAAMTEINQDALHEAIKQNARTEVAELIQEFQATPKTRRDAYSEDDVSRLLLRLFAALGWQVLKPSEVSGQENIDGKRADYGFYLGGQPVFYLEMKETRANLDDKRWIRQAINYAWQRGTTWAVLSNFQRIRVFIAEELPAKGDEENTRFIPDLTIDQYLERFDELWLLSKPAMQARLLDKEAERVGKKAKARSVNTVEKQLSSQFITWRDTLTAGLMTLNDDDLFESIDSAVQRLLDRMIFLKTMEDRGVETGRRMIEIVRQKVKGDPFAALLAHFRAMDDVYDSNLFRPSRLDSLAYTDQPVVRKFIESFYEIPNTGDRYDFAAISVDVLGRVYEDYLGESQTSREERKTDSIAQARARQGQRLETIRRKRAKRKSKGIYYTPQYVVRYILQQTLGQLLESGRDPHSLRILDPACGSGGFLIAAFDLLDSWLAKHEPHVSPAQRKRRIITENLYGVDLDAQAVEITRLNLVLRAAEERVTLPTLDATIKNADSLMLDWREAFPGVIGANGGFDVVVGNPPYVRQETLTAAYKDDLQARYQTYTGTADLYVYFIERGISLLRPGGRYGVIVANKWMRAAYGKPLRRWLKTQPLEEIIDFGDLPVFHDAITYPCIVISQSAASPPSPLGEGGRGGEGLLHAAQIKTLAFDDLGAVVRASRYPLHRAALDDNGWSLAGTGSAALLDKIKAAGVPLGEYVGRKIYIGIKTGLNEAFVIDGDTRARLIAQDARSADLIKPYLAGRDVKRYAAPQADKYVILIPNGWTREYLQQSANGTGTKTAPAEAWAWFSANYPAIAQHLTPFADRAAKRTDQGEYWW
ncbi:MAG: N-6 DNA methylase, partial [bacterium]|nr:N-6 DNA methylase [bacterium]